MSASSAVSAVLASQALMATASDTSYPEAYAWFVLPMAAFIFIGIICNFLSED